MKRLFLIALCLFLTASAAAARDKLSSDTRFAVTKAVSNEMEAVARYEAFAAKANEEGYLGAAALFRACARAEKIHAGRFAALIDQAGVTAVSRDSVTVGPTEDNLRTAMAAETAERDKIYQEAIATAKLHGEGDVAKVFDQTRDVETEHGNLLAAALRSLPTMKAAKEYYVCGRCGYTMDIDLARCPSCQHPEHLTAVK